MTPRGLVLGRRWDSDVVLEDGRASQVHALVLLTLNGPELLVLGKNATHVDGTERRGRLLLHDGAILEVPGGRFRVELVLGSEWASEGWWLETDSGRRYGLRALPFTVGGDTTDHLQLAGWPPVALRFFAARGAVAVEFGADGGALNDTVVPAGTTEIGYCHKHGRKIHGRSRRRLALQPFSKASWQTRNWRQRPMMCKREI